MRRGPFLRIALNDLHAFVCFICFISLLMYPLFFCRCNVSTPRFLREVFQLFAENSLSIDMVATSEVSISLTLDQEQDRESLLR